MAGQQGAALRWLSEVLERDTLNPSSRKGQPTQILKLDINAPPPQPAPAPLPAPMPAPAPGPAAGAG